MAKQKQTFYCLSCGNLISGEEAKKTFRTGFYRAVYPLAICKDKCGKSDSLNR
jgi:hypothetical protein